LAAAFWLKLSSGALFKIDLFSCGSAFHGLSPGWIQAGAAISGQAACQVDFTLILLLRNKLSTAKA
jgi:hypothetical protein